VTRRALRQVVADVRVRPGWRVSVEKAFAQPPEAILVLRGRVRDAGGPGTVLTEFVEFMPDLSGLTPRAVLRRVLRLLDQAERHETREWLRYRGARPFDPHGSLR
jgi:hypothetical protein